MKMGGDREREEIIQQLKNVRYKKNQGELYLSKKRVGWMAENTDVFQISILVSEIRTQKISPESKPKVQLQIVLLDQLSHTFHFCNEEGREKQVAERDNIKERLAELIQASKRKLPDEMMEKKRLLEENSSLKGLYTSLVPTNILQSDEFWKVIGAQYKQRLVPSQDQGVSGSFLADVKPQTDGSNGKVQYNITQELLQSIYKVYPSVKKKHDDNVPHRMTESEFWTRFFQSHYYSVHITARSENVFSEAAKYDEKEWVRDIGSIQGDAMYDLGDIYEEMPMAVEEDLRIKGSKAGSNSMHATMIKRFNQQSINILKSQEQSQKEKIQDEIVLENPDARIDPNIEVEPPKSKKARLEEKILYEDLESNNKAQTSSLQIHQKDRYLTAPDACTEEKLETNQVKMLQMRLTGAVSRWQPNLQESQHSDYAYRVLESHAEECRKKKGGGDFKEIELPRELHDQLVTIYRDTMELMGHFYKSISGRQPAENIHPIVRALQKYQDNTVRPFGDKAIREYNVTNKLLDHLTLMFEKVYERYESVKNRPSR